MNDGGKARGLGVIVCGALAASGALALSGCPPTIVETCAAGYVLDATGTCVPDGVTDAGPRDAAIDTGVPTDAPTDAGPCSRCPAERPACVADTCVECASATDCADSDAGRVCDPMTHECVQCLGATDCTGATPHCAATHVCVGCLAETDCTSLTASRCDASTSACVGCTADEDCERFADTPVCDEPRGTCVACTGDTEAARCEGNSCRRSDGVCTSTPVGSKDVCDACEADSECAAGRLCVTQTFGGTSVGAFCFLDARSGCGDTTPALRPYSVPADLTSIDGVAGRYCMLPSTTTCQGLRDARTKPCTTDTDCGVMGLDDGYCPTGGAMGLCSYACAGGADCGPGLTCGGVPQHCRP